MPKLLRMRGFNDDIAPLKPGILLPTPHLFHLSLPTPTANPQKHTSTTPASTPHGFPKGQLNITGVTNTPALPCAESHLSPLNRRKTKMGRAGGEPEGDALEDSVTKAFVCCLVPEIQPYIIQYLAADSAGISNLHKVLG